jgi:diguanylate cyclase (GGDEF)-like protein/PAS domain S-box-containing protein
MDQSHQRAATSRPDLDQAMSCGLPDTFPSAVFIADAQGVIAYASDAFIAQMGASRPDVLGKTLFDFLVATPDSPAAAALLGDHSVADMTADLQRRDGSTCSVLLCADHWRDPDGQQYRLIQVADQTAINQAQKDLALAKLHLECCLESSKAGTWEWNVQTNEIRIDDRWAASLGYSVKDLEPLSRDTLLHLTHPDDIHLVCSGSEHQTLTERETPDVEVRMRHRNGHDVWVRHSGHVISRTPDQKPEWLFGTHILIDHEKKTHQALQARYSILERVSNLSGVGAWEVDIKTQQVFWSQETKRIHGVSERYEPTIKEGINFYAPEARPIISAAVENGMTTGQSWDLELPFIRKNGQRIWVRAFSAVEFKDGEPDRIIGAFQEITEKVHDRNELIAAKEWTAYAAAKGRVGLWSLDTVLGELNWDSQMTSHFGFAPGSEPKTVSDWLKSLSLDSRRQLKVAVRNSMFSGTDLDLELTLQTSSGQHKVLKVVGAPHLDQEDTVDRLQGACFDLTEHRQMMARLEEQASKLSVTLSSIGDGVITADDMGRVTWMNPEAEKITGRTAQEVEGMQSVDLLRIVDEKTRDPIPCPIEDCLKQRSVVILAPNAVLLRPDDTEIAIDDSVAPLLDSEDRIIGAVMVFRDSSTQRGLSRDIAFRANHDSLTGLLNREAFLRQLEACLADPVKQNGSYLFFIDLDHFKRINDSIGHEAGDAVLACIADVLRESVDETAAVSRLGGDEFSILLRAKTQERAEAIGKDICRRATEGSCLKRSMDISINTGTSIGIVSLANQHVTAAEALKMADIAAYAAKNNGRGQICVWSDLDVNMQAMSRQTSLINLIEDATRDGSWIVQEQCIQRVDAIGDSNTFAELLIRLPDGNGGMIAPSDFLPAAERYGLMQEIDLWMCNHALARIAATLQVGAAKLYSVNISASSVSSGRFRRSVLDLLGAAPEQVRKLLCFEVTETAILTNYDGCRQFLANLRTLGASVAIDDFGAGSTSFRHFQHLPADYLKIDGSFIQNMNNPIEAASIQCFLRMAEVANFQTIAEHVEDADQIAALAALKVDFLQGFALGRPE